MRKALFIIGGAIIFLVVLAVLYALFTKKKDGTPAERIAFPIASSTEVTQEPSSVGSITTLDFINNGTTIEDPANKGQYYLAGTSGYCYDDGTCAKAGTEESFNIVYFSADQSFAISLNEEPIGEVRKRAEQYLMQALGINQTQMCSLKYYLGTTVHINPVYGTMGNLGFSFCPNAVTLP